MAKGGEKVSESGGFEAWLKEKGFTDSSVTKLLEEEFSDADELKSLNKRDIESLNLKLAQRKLLERVISSLHDQTTTDKQLPANGKSVSTKDLAINEAPPKLLESLGSSPPKDLLHTEPEPHISHKFAQASITHNITGMKDGKADTVYAAYNMHFNGESNDPVQKLKDHTQGTIISHTEGMIKVSGVDLAIQKLQEKNWVTVTGNAGEGKTTLGYMVLKHLNSEDVFQSVKGDLERYGPKILDPGVVINLSESQHEEERLEILNYHLNEKIIQINGDVIRRVARSHTPHGFAHCCKMYTELKSEERPDIEEFFKSPLKFLDATTRVLVQRGYMYLFKNMIKEDGKLILAYSNDDNQYEEIKRDTSNLSGSYIMKKSGSLPQIWTFTHPSIYESVVNIIGETNCWFIVKHASISVLLQMVNIKETDINLPGVVNIDPEPALLDALCERFRQELLERDFSVFKHKFSDNLYFCKRLIKTCVHKDQDQAQSHQVKTTVSINERDVREYSMLQIAGIGGRHTAISVLLEHGADVNQADQYGWTALHSLCESDKVDACTVQLLITHGADVKKADQYGRTALHNMCVSDKVDTSTVQLLIIHGADVNQADMYGRTALHYLCESDKVDACTVQLLISHGADVNQADEEYGRTALHYLCESDKVDASTLQLLITHGADVNQADEHGWTALHYLCRSDKVDTSTLQLLITHGADANQAEMYGRTALHYLCRSDKVDNSTLQLLITHGADVNQAERNGRTALHYLCMSDKVDTSTLQLLITHGADVNQTDQYGRTALHYLCRSEKVDTNTLQLLITHGADVNQVDKEYGRTALHYLCEGDEVDASTQQLLLTNGADVNQTDQYGRTALHYLCRSEKVDTNTLQLLITHGADVNQADKEYGRTALHYLCMSDKVDTSTLQLLITHGADVNQADQYGRTALHYICRSYKVDTSTLQLLITHGADVNQADQYGRTALHYLCRSDKVDTSTLQLLITHGADVNQADVYGRTALHYLLGIGKVDASTLQLLLIHGADVNKAERYGITSLDYLRRDVDADTLQLLMSSSM